MMRSICFVAALATGLLASAPAGSQEQAASQPARETQPQQEPGRDQPTAGSGPRVLPGMQESGKILLPNGWSLKPAGKQIKLGDFPVNIALHPQGRYAAVLHAGFGEHEVRILDLTSQKVLSQVVVDQAFYGLCFSPDGTKLYVSGGEYSLVREFAFEEGYLSRPRGHQLDKPATETVVGGISFNHDGSQLLVACPWGDRVFVLPVRDGQVDVAAMRRVDLQEEDYPYLVLADPSGKRLFVSLWAEAKVAVLDAQTLKELARWETQPHPTEMLLSPDGKRLYVACADSNDVSVLDAATGQGLEVIASSLYPQAPKGSTPNSMSLSPDGKVLLVANANNNNVAVVDVSIPGQSRSLGFLPAGWYPTSVRFDLKGETIYIANGKGGSSKANRLGPNPENQPPRTVSEYIGGLFQGTLQFVDVPSPQNMASLTKVAFACSPLRQDFAPTAKPQQAGHPIPAQVGQPSPIKYCVYIIKENRTYDQVFGDLPQGNGDPSLCIFPRKVTPNHHKLAEEFVLLDNFYVESEVSADGHEWTMGAYATDFVEKSWPLLYRGGQGVIDYPAEGGALKPAAPSGGYFWDRCAEAGVSYRSYGEFIQNAPQPGMPSTAAVKALEGHFDPLFRGYDLDYTDVKRAERFIKELGEFEQKGEYPQFVVLRLPNDHTYGTRPGKHTPTAMVADNDLALGMVVEALSNSKFWKQMAIFVIQDDAQNGSDHVDAHRTVALVVSPYCKRGVVDSTMYSTASMLRTMGLILGTKPMSQFDAAARPMYPSFQRQPNFTPYKHLPANVDLNARNPADAYGAKLSLEMDFTKEDAADDLLLNEVVWRSVRGADSPMPPPVRAAFVFPHLEEDEEDEDDHQDAEEDQENNTQQEQDDARQNREPNTQRPS